MDKQNFNDKLENLPPRQRQVLKLFIQGNRDQKIAEELKINQDTVRTHIKNLCKHFDLKNEPGERYSLRPDLRKLCAKHKPKWIRDNNSVVAINQDEIMLSALGESEETITTLYQDWGEAPDASILSFYGRTEELVKLKQWIVKERCRLVVLSGMPGIGKTSLAVNLAKQIQGNFEYLIWRSLENNPPISEIIASLFQSFYSQQTTKADLPERLVDRVLHLIEFLKKHRCLLVLDNIESILQKGERAGRYCQEYEGYSELLKRLGEHNHQSCLLLIGREQPRDIAALAGESLPVRILPLKGLQEEAAKEILKAKDLAEPNHWGELVKRYRGNPLALMLVSPTIKDVFDGKVSEIIKLNTMLLTDNLSELLEPHFYRLSQLEREILYWLVIEWEPVARQQLQQEVSSAGSVSDFVEALKSLRWRSLLEKNESYFTLQPIVKSFVKKQLLEQLFRDMQERLRSQNTDRRTSLIKYDLARNKNNNLINSLKYKLFQFYSKPIVLHDKVSCLLSNFKGKSRIEVGYAEINLENLLAVIQSALDNS